jgi:hypothetical protein
VSPRRIPKLGALVKPAISANPPRHRASRRPGGPPLWDLPDARTGDFDPHAQPAPKYEFDQRIAW